jgi:hypothetical protein
MSDHNGDAKTKRPGEKPAGKFHYNPVNMAGKKAEIVEERDQEIAKEKREAQEESNDSKSGRDQSRKC